MPSMIPLNKCTYIPPPKIPGMESSLLRAVNGSEDDESKALDRAIRLSMAESSMGPDPNNVIDLTGDQSEPESDGEGALRNQLPPHIIAHSGFLPDSEFGSDYGTAADSDVKLSPKRKEPAVFPSRKGKEKAVFASPEPTETADLGNYEGRTTFEASFQGRSFDLANACQPSSSKQPIDRKAMEAERLVRVQKRFREEDSRYMDHVEAERQKRLAKLMAPGPSSQASSAAGKRTMKSVAAIKNESESYATDSNSCSSAPGVSPPARRRRLEVEDDEDDDNEEAAALPAKEPRAASLPSAANAALPTEAPEAAPSPPPANAARPTEASQATSSRPTIRLSFPNGAVKKTRVRGQPRLGDDISLDEIWCQDQLVMAVLSSFQWDQDFFMPHIDVWQTRLILVAYATNEEQRNTMRANANFPSIRFCFPPVPLHGIMHSKLQLLCYPTYLRIVVPTGNLVAHDWGDSGLLENMVFLIDLPVLPHEFQLGANPTLTPFFEDLTYYLRAQGLGEFLLRSLRKYDFSETNRFGFVHSIQGCHMNEAFFRTGYPGLGRAVQSLGLATPYPIQMDYLTSSLGAIDDDFLKALYFACQGDSGLKEFSARQSRKRNGSTPSGLRNNMRIYFPSEETVASSLGGRDAAGTICFRSTWWNKPKFPREVLRDVLSTRQGVLMHTKLLLVQPKPMGFVHDRVYPRAWAYVGSANMSESAWGHVLKDRMSGKPKLICRNWECGVIVPVSEASAGPISEPVEDEHLLDVFRDVIPVPFLVPGIGYSFPERSPWFFKD